MPKPMTITEAFLAVTREYNDECLRVRDNAALQELMQSTVCAEYQEIDQALPDYVGEILAHLEMPPGYLDPRIYTMVRMVFRFGMRTQRKLDRPEEATSMFWRSDQRSI